MRIRSVTTAVVEANYDWTIVRVESEDGLHGWGDTPLGAVLRRHSSTMSAR